MRAVKGGPEGWAAAAEERVRDKEFYVRAMEVGMRCADHSVGAIFFLAVLAEHHLQDGGRGAFGGEPFDVQTVLFRRAVGKSGQSGGKVGDGGA